MPTQPADPFAGFNFLLLEHGQPLAGFQEVTGLNQQDGLEDIVLRLLTLKRGLVEATFLKGWQEHPGTSSTGEDRTLILQLKDERAQSVACAWKLTQARLYTSRTSTGSDTSGLVPAEELGFLFRTLELEQGY